MAREKLGALIVGFGPAGMGVFTGALRDGSFEDLLAIGVRTVDRAGGDDSGSLGRYDIDSDSSADSFASVVGSWDDEVFRPHGEWAATVAATWVDSFTRVRGRSVPLRWAAALHRDVTACVLHQARCRGVPDLLTSAIVRGARLLPDGTWRVETDGDVSTRHVTSLVLATGAGSGRQPLDSVVVGSRRPMQDMPTKTVGSDDVLGPSGARIIRQMLEGSTCPSAVVVGGSHSALAAARVLLDSGLDWPDDAVTIAHRNRLRPMYATAEEARREGFTDFDDNDICPRTGRVLPLAGFRMASRELLCSALGLGGRSPDPRLRLHRIDDGVDGLLDACGLIVLATGYEVSSIPLVGAAGDSLRLWGRRGRGYVDARSRVLDARGHPVPGLYMTGFGAGYPLGGLYGEPSFDGVANGTSLWQGDIGSAIATELIERHRYREKLCA